MTEATAPTAKGVTASLAEELAVKRVALDMAKDAEKLAQEEYDKVEADLFDALENAGIRSVRTERGLFSLNDLAWATVTDEAAARAWAEAHMPELLLLNRQRLSVVVRQHLKGEEGVDMPDGVDFRTQRKITWRRS